ncbi:MAG: cytochrome c biogenesis protein ResB [Candidatus Sumerlaeia bacterium]|nr:cytochrome c biogenesis protein ResB [Candidatus Sumerlaeia bacterium]
MDSSIPGESPAARPANPLLRVMDAVDRAILRGWRVFKSLKFGIFLLVLIGAVSVWGTMGYASNASLGDNQIPMARRLVFQTWWFASLLATFAIQLTVSTWHVTVMSVTIWWRREFRRFAAWYAAGGTTPRAVLSVPAERTDDVAALLRRRFTTLQRDDDALFAQRGLLSRLGPTIVHAGMLMVLGSGMARFLLHSQGEVMAEGRFIVAENEASNLIYEPIDEAQAIGGRNVTAREIPEKLYIRVLDFDEIQHPNIGSPAYFSSLVEIVDPLSGQVTVRQLDMNHSMSLHGYQFHQAGYEAVEDETPQRWNFDVRVQSTGERVAVTDAGANTPVRIGDTDYHMIVAAGAPGAPFEIFHRDNPQRILARGTVGGSTGAREFTFEVVQFFPNFQIDPVERKPINAGNEPLNPALQVVTYLDGETSTVEWLFADRELAAIARPQDPVYQLKLADIRVPADAAEVDFQKPGEVKFVLDVVRRSTGASLGQVPLFLDERSRPFAYDLPEIMPQTTGNPATGEDFAVINLGPAQRYLTVLSVVREPTTMFVNLGIGVILIGALMTFLSRYEALHGWHDRASGRFHLTLTPRWGYASEASAAALGALVAEARAKLGVDGELLPYTVRKARKEATESEKSIADPQAITST